jgi:hypothetical protein
MIDDYELDLRLSEDGRAWRTTRTTGPEFKEAIRALDTTTSTSRRHWRTAAVAAASVVVIVAAAFMFRSHSQQPSGPTHNGPHLATCGRAPVRSGALAAQVALTISAPTTGKSGTTIEVTAWVRAVADSVDLDAGAPAEVVIIENGYVVGRYRGAVGGTGYGGHIDTRGKPVPAQSILLSGCPSGHIDYAHPDASRHPLPSGHYQLIATLGPDGPGAFKIVSNPSPITITK